MTGAQSAPYDHTALNKVVWALPTIEISRCLFRIHPPLSKQKIVPDFSCPKGSYRIERAQGHIFRDIFCYNGGK
jgi:hypothetical protein